MTAELVLDNAQVVLRDRIIAGHVVCRDGEIAEIGEGRTGAAGVLDLDGDFLLPREAGLRQYSDQQSNAPTRQQESRASAQGNRQRRERAPVPHG